MQPSLKPTYQIISYLLTYQSSFIKFSHLLKVFGGRFMLLLSSKLSAFPPDKVMFLLSLSLLSSLLPLLCLPPLFFNIL